MSFVEFKLANFRETGDRRTHGPTDGRTKPLIDLLFATKNAPFWMVAMSFGPEFGCEFGQEFVQSQVWTLLTGHWSLQV